MSRGKRKTLALLCSLGRRGSLKHPTLFLLLPTLESPWDNCPTCDPDSSVAVTLMAYKQGGV